MDKVELRGSARVLETGLLAPLILHPDRRRRTAFNHPAVHRESGRRWGL